MRKQVFAFSYGHQFSLWYAGVYVQETKTAFYVTIHPSGWAFPVVFDFKVAKGHGVTSATAVKTAYDHYVVQRMF